VKIYVTRGTQKEISELRRLCDQNGWEIKLMNRLGRPRVSYDVQKVLNAYRELKKIRATARRLQMNPGPVYRILKEAGVLEFQTKR
jgi:hypothetical protein